MHARAPLLRAAPDVSPAELRAGLELPALDRVQALYDEVRLLDAYELTKEAWRYDAVSLGLEVEELVLAARLAVRLGSPQRHALLIRLAQQRAPGSPLVEFYDRSRSFHHGSSYLEARRLLDAVPDGPPSLRSDWLGAASVRLGTLRDFETAEALLARARDLEHDSTWIDACTATVALERGAWDEAETLALKAWAQAPGRTPAARVLATARVKQGRPLEGAELLLRWIEDGGQSFEVLAIALGVLLTVAQASAGEASVAAARRVLMAAEPLERLAPLADPKLRRMFAFMRAEASRLAGDHAQLAQHARHVASPFYEEVAERLARGATGTRSILPHRSIAQQHDTCVPASVATCASVFGLDVDQDALAGEVTWGGTAMWRVLDHAERQGWQARVFTVRAEIATALLERGLPFVVTLFGIDMGHACAAVGIDPAMGTLIVHDPAGPGTRELLLDKLHVGQAPLGPMGVLLVPPAVPPSVRAELDELHWPDQDEQRTCLEIERTAALHSTREAAALARALRSTSDLAAYVRALGVLLEGRPHAVLDELVALAARHPETPSLQAVVVRCAEEIRNVGLLVERLEALVLPRRRAGVESRQAWFQAPAGLVARYASLLRGTTEARRRAQRLLHEALWREETSAPCMEVLGDLAWEERRFDDARWAYRWASTLRPDSESAAQTYAWALKKHGQREEGLSWLRARVEHAREHAASGADPWVSWVQTLEDFGQPRRALDEAERVAADAHADGERAAFAARLLARYGRREAAERALAVAERAASRASYHTAACTVAHSAGEPERALEHAIAWGQEDPRNVAAIALRVRLVRGLQGTQAALELARQQVEQRPGHAELEDLLLAELERHEAHEEREQILQRRIDTNPYEVWALRELGHDLVARAQGSSGEARAELLRRAQSLCTRCQAHDPGHAATLALRGNLALLQGDLEDAARCFGAALVQDPDYGYALQQLGEVMQRTPAAERPALVEHLDRAAEAAHHDLGMARHGARLIAAHVGLEEAERALERWSARSPDDPQIIEARADLQLDYGLGASAAERVRPELEAAVESYPLHSGLRLSLARAHRALDRHVDAMAEYGRLAHDFPNDLGIQHELSQLFIEAGEPETAVELLEEVVRRGPGQVGAWLALADALVQVGEAPRAIEQLRAAHAKMPSNSELLERLAERLRLQGPEGVAESIALTTAAAERFPDSASLQAVHAAHLARCGAAPGVVDEAFRRAIACDVHRWEPVHDYSLQLAAAGRHEDALALLEEHLAHTTDPSAVEGQRAVILRQAGDARRAREVMCAALEAYPDYAWGWYTLMAWVQEDDEPGVAREMLPKMSPTLVHAPVVQAQALRVRQWAGAEPESLEPHWARLVADYAREPAVALVRAEVLLEQRRHEEALAVLDRLPPGRRGEPRVLARAIRARVASGDQAAALADLRTIWRARGQSYGLPTSTVAALMEAKWLEPAAEAMLADLEAGERVSPDMIMSVGATLAQAKPELPAIVDRIISWLGEHDDAESHRVLGTIFDALCDADRAARVLKWRKKHPTLARRALDVWLAVARALLITGRLDELVEWFEGWREREGLEMWGVSNYLAAVWRRKEWARCHEEARWTLEHVAPDHTLPRVVALLLDAGLMVCGGSPTQDFGAYLEDYDRYATALELDPELRPDWERRIYADLRALLATTDPSELRDPAASLRGACSRVVLDQDWRMQLARAYLRHHLSWWQRLWIRV